MLFSRSTQSMSLLRRLSDHGWLRKPYIAFAVPLALPLLLASVELKVNGWGEIDAIRDGANFDVTPRPAQQREIETHVAATIDSSLYEALRNAGESPQLVQQLADVFQWDIDFFALRKGDSFS